jgi:NAD(P)H-dependent nitrite reductase small subunit
MSGYQPVCRAAEIPPGSARLAVIDGKEIAIFHVDGRFYAMEDTCLHAGGPLHEGSLEGTKVICPWHDWTFDVTSGQCGMNPKVSLDCYAVRVVDGVVQVATGLGP